MREIDITKKEEGQRIDKFLLKYLNQASKAFIYKMIRKKNIKLNEKKIAGNEMLIDGDCIKIFLAEETILKFKEDKRVQKADKTFSIIYEDENVLFCNKPAGLIVHPDKVNKSNTLNDQILYYLQEKGEYNAKLDVGFTPSICNRIDRNTSGIVTVGKNLAAIQELNKGFRDKLIDKYYLTVVNGVIEQADIISGYHKKDDNNTTKLSSKDNGGDYVVTKYKPIVNNGQYTLLEVKLETGKSHQIRVSMNHIGHPIIGDRKYGLKAVNDYFKAEYALEYQFLHSFKLISRLKDSSIDYLYDKEFIASPSEELCNIIKSLFKYKL